MCVAHYAESRREVFPACKGTFHLISNWHRTIFADKSAQVRLHADEIITCGRFREEIFSRVLILFHFGFAAGHRMKSLACNGPSGLHVWQGSQNVAGLSMRFHEHFRNLWIGLGQSMHRRPVLASLPCLANHLREVQGSLTELAPYAFPGEETPERAEKPRNTEARCTNTNI